MTTVHGTNRSSSARLLLLLVASVAIGVASALTLPSASRAGMLGDVVPVNKDASGNITGYGDGQVDVNDLMRVLRAWWGTQPLAPEQLAAADVAPPGGDGAITSADVLLYVRAIVLRQDVDGDGLANEVDTRTSPFSPDTDGDGLCDGPLNSAAAQAGRCTGGEDLNGDGVVQANETNPASADTDGDGLCDGPLNSAAAQAGLCSGGEDLNGNGHVDANETSPLLADTDGDGLCDGPLNSAAAAAGKCSGGEDKNGNGVVDSGETSPLLVDTDGDGLCDGPVGWIVNPNDPTQVLCSGSEDANGNGVVDAPQETDPTTPTTYNGTPDATYLQQGTPCTGCFALVIMPDTQYYNDASEVYVHQSQVHGPEQLQTMMRYICANRSSWREPGTGKTMPIVAVAQLGDIVQNGDAHELEWQRASAAFDVLDSCSSGPVPYVLIPGNHDYMVNGDNENYSQPMPFYNHYFAAPCMPNSTACDAVANPPRAGWAAPHFCTNPPNCATGEYFLGSGDDIGANTRDLVDNQGNPKTGGPPTAEPGRQRAIIVPTPGGGQLMIIGLDLGFDFDLNDGVHGDDLDWVESLLAAYPNTPTIFIQHALFAQAGGSNFPDGDVHWGSDTSDLDQTGRPWGKQVWDKIVSPYPEVFMALNGHRLPPPHANTQPTSAGTAPNVRTVYRLFRNFQEVYQQADPSNHTVYDGASSELPSGATVRLTAGGAGWTTVIVFDPNAQEIRTRSYRVDDVDYYRTRAAFEQGLDTDPTHIDTSHDGPLPSTYQLDMDQGCSNYAADCPQTLPWNLP